jgi:lysophospholipase L1-like esterase
MYSPPTICALLPTGFAYLSHNEPSKYPQIRVSRFQHNVLVETIWYRLHSTTLMTQKSAAIGLIMDPSCCPHLTLPRIAFANHAQQSELTFAVCYGVATMTLVLALLLSAVLQVAPAAAAPKVINFGYPGFNTAELDAKLDQALQIAKPKYVILMAGANDALNDKKFLLAEQTHLHLQAMVRRAQASGATVILVTTHDPDLKRLLQRHRPEDYGASSPLDRLAIVNSIVVEVGAQQKVAVVDFHRTLAKEGGANTDLSSDGVHLTAKGYGMLARAVRAKLPEEIPAQDTVLCFGDSLTYGYGVRESNSEETPLTYPSQLRQLLQK